MCVGFRRRFEGLLEELLGTIRYVRSGGLRITWRASPFGEIDADVVAIDVHRFFLPGFRRADWLIVPEEVRWRGDLSALPPARPSKSLRSNMNRVENAGFVLEEAGTPADWDEFFETMVLPYLSTRFEGGAKLPAGSARRTLQRKGMLFFVTREGSREAGGCLLPTPRGVLFRRLGVRGGDPEIMREGALSALYLFLFDWARARGYEEFDSGTTFPLAREGLARFKEKMGLETAPDPIALTAAFRFNTDHEELMRHLDRCPVFHEVDHRIETYP